MNATALGAAQIPGICHNIELKSSRSHKNPPFAESKTDCNRLEMLIVTPCCLKAFSQSSLVMSRGSVKASRTTTVNVIGQKPVSHIITVRDRGEVSCDWLRAENRRVFFPGKFFSPLSMKLVFDS